MVPLNELQARIEVDKMVTMNSDVVRAINKVRLKAGLPLLEVEQTGFKNRVICNIPKDITPPTIEELVEISDILQERRPDVWGKKRECRVG